MAVVRELITLLGTEVDATGFKQYEAGINRVKSLALGLAKMAGIAFSVDKIIEFADGLMDAGKEVNKLTAQLKLILRPMDDINTITEGVFDLSQRLGVSYTHMLGTYREFANEVRDTKIPTEDILAAVENIQKGFEVARATPEQQSQVMEALQRGFRSGKMRPVSIGLMKDILPPEAFNMVLRQFNLGVGDEAEKKLRELAQKGEVTAESIIAAFKKSSDALNAQWNAVPQKLGRVFTRIYNDLTKVTSQIYKMVDASVFMGRVVWYVWTQMTYYVRMFTQYLGGLENVVQLVSIAIGVVMTRALVMATAATIRWGIVSWSALAPWLAIGAAVIAVALGIQDLMYWVQNKHSMIGTWVGPFEKLSENFKKLDIFAGFRVFGDLIKGDWKQAWEDAKTAVTDTKAIVLELTAAVAVTFVAWQAIKFIQVIAGIGEVAAAVVGVKTAAVEAEGAIVAMNAAGAAGAGGAASKGAGLLGTLMKGLSVFAGVYLGLSIGKKGGVFGDLNAGEKEQLDEYKRLHPNLAPIPPEPVAPGAAPLPDTTPATPEQKKQIFFNWLDSKFGYLLPGMGKLGEAIHGGPFVRGGDASSVEKEGGAPKPLLFQDWNNKPAGALPPGAMGPPPPGPVTNNVQPVFNQNNNIKVETALDAAQIGQIIGDKVGSLVGDQLGSFSRSLTVGAPRIEAPIQ